MNSNLKSRLHARFSCICCIFSHEVSASGYCLQELKHNSKAIYLVMIILFDHELWLDTVQCTCTCSGRSRDVFFELLCLQLVVELDLNNEGKLLTLFL